MNYVINKFIKETGQLVVTFDGNHKFAIDLQLNADGLYPTGEELEAYIQGFAPVDFINRSNLIAAGVPNAADIEALVTHPEQEVVAQEQYQVQAQTEVEKFVLAALIKNGIIPA